MRVLRSPSSAIGQVLMPDLPEKKNKCRQDFAFLLKLISAALP
jgi:hypothetical protein